MVWMRGGGRCDVWYGRPRREEVSWALGFNRLLPQPHQMLSGPAHTGHLYASLSLSVLRSLRLPSVWQMLVL